MKSDTNVNDKSNTVPFQYSERIAIQMINAS